MRQNVLTGLAGFVLALWAGQALALDCPQMPMSLHVKSDVTQDLVVDDTKSFREIGQKRDEQDKETYTGGLTDGNFDLKHWYSTKWQPSRDQSSFCTWFSDMTVRLNYKATIYIAKEIPKGSCLYDAVMDHEMRHYTTDQQLIEKYVGVTKEKIKDFVLGEGRMTQAMPLVQRQQVESALFKRLNQIMNDDVYKAFWYERDMRQNMVDSPSEYKRVEMLCPKEAYQFALEKPDPAKQ